MALGCIIQKIITIIIIYQNLIILVGPEDRNPTTDLYFILYCFQLSRVVEILLWIVLLHQYLLI